MQVDRPDPQTYLAQALTSPQLPEELKPFYQAFERFYSNKYVPLPGSVYASGSARVLVGAAQGRWSQLARAHATLKS